MSESLSVTPRPTVVCVCGSTRFIDTIAIVQWKLEKRGFIVLGLHLLPDSYSEGQAHHQAEHEGVKESMDDLHLRKVEMADRIYVVNQGGYVGESTNNEIIHARNLGKPVDFLEPREKDRLMVHSVKKSI